MTYKEYAKKLSELKDKAQKSILKDISGIEKDIFFDLVDMIEKSLETKDGKIIPSKASISFLNSFTDYFITMINELKDYKGNVSRFIRNLKSVETFMSDFQKSKGVNIAKANVTSASNMVVDEIIDRYLANGLNSEFVQPLRNILFQNISMGATMKELKKTISDYIQGNKDKSGKLSSYMTQTAMQGADSYSGIINQKIMNTFEYDTLIMSGSLIDTSSEQCVYCIEELGGIIRRKDWKKVSSIAKENGLIEGTTFDTLPFNKLHWGCRHEFTPSVTIK